MGESNVKTPLLREHTSVDFDFILKVLIVGDSVVGKSQLFKRFAGEPFVEEHESTQTVEYRHRYIDTAKNRCKVQVWDCVSTASKAVMTSIYKGSNAVILLFDVTNSESLRSIPDWLHEISGYAPAGVSVYLVGTKIDDEHREVSTGEGEYVADKHALQYFEVSSKTGAGVDSIFNKIVHDLEDSTVGARDAKEGRISVAEKSTREYKDDKGVDEFEDGEKSCCPCCSVM
eukprot:CAMPEP_0185040448 /NCGR_PEP_ID=MMETSP1103-20130426/38507_1 /TAXON_ID=36769 /ORGANISM="Paraphysomonas bandaiensis, Strain Caron Lab Isolate" /LENGTH=229 /DNA_ID=CAMNT_0027579749 /DNA_START=52 /DNA_END=741 /DNA_ORIENTATION=+